MTRRVILALLSTAAAAANKSDRYFPAKQFTREEIGDAILNAASLASSNPLTQKCSQLLAALAVTLYEPGQHTCSIATDDTAQSFSVELILGLKPNG